MSYYEVIESRIFDGFGNPIHSDDQALDIHVQHTHKKPRYYNVHIETGINTTLASASIIGSYQIIVSSSAGMIIGNKLKIGPINNEESLLFEIININGQIITLDNYLELPHNIGESIQVIDINLAINGGTIQIPKIFNAHPSNGKIIHILEMKMIMLHKQMSDDSLFGSINQLINGIGIRLIQNSIMSNIFNFKSISDMRLYAKSVDYTDASRNQTLYSTTISINMYESTGAVFVLDANTNDKIEILIKDNLVTSVGNLTSFYINFLAHASGE